MNKYRNQKNVETAHKKKITPKTESRRKKNHLFILIFCELKKKSNSKRKFLCVFSEQRQKNFSNFENFFQKLKIFSKNQKLGA